MMTPVDKDWVQDETLSRDETLRRFEALEPTPTRGPRVAGGSVVTAANTVGGRTIEVHPGVRPRISHGSALALNRA